MPRRTTEQVAARRYQVQLILIALQEKFPYAFYLKPKKPRAIWEGCIEEAINAVSDRFEENEIKKAIKYYFQTPMYLKSIVQKTWYRDLQGHPIELIANEQKESAQRRLDAMELQSKSNKPVITYKK
jgi:sRNA-binding protein